MTFTEWRLTSVSTFSGQDMFLGEQAGGAWVWPVGIPGCWSRHQSDVLNL